MARHLLDRILHGALAGINGAATMTVLRMLAHRAGLLDQMVPQKVEQWAQRTAGVSVAPVPSVHRAVDHVLHLGYGATWGAVYGALTPRPRPGGAVAFGVGVWAIGACILFPTLRIGRPAWRSSAGENTMNIAAHLVYSSVTAFLTEEFSRQPLRDVASRSPASGRVG